MSKCKPCRVAGCLRLAKAYGLCEAHYNRLKRIGDLKVDQPILALNVKRGSLRQILKGLRNWRG